VILIHLLQAIQCRSIIQGKYKLNACETGILPVLFFNTQAGCLFHKYLFEYTGRMPVPQISTLNTQAGCLFHKYLFEYTGRMPVPQISV
jgi:hypothetical protein